ncbi:YncE family protein [Nocardia neocaledoniensis]|uniref:YncE family protein n=1 Tax=Nocardia neocaledoniensis TaxID=236511 RepID=UPI0024562EFF|nr:YncE family protein [Nocardia neocaledoniensis]
MAAPTTTDPAAVGGSSVGPGPYRVEATVPVGPSPRGVALDPGARRAYVAHYVEGAGRQSVSVIDTRSNVVTAEIPVGQVFPDKPQAIAVDPTTRLVYLAGGNSAGKMCVIDPDSSALIATIEVDGDPVAVVVDPARNLVYVANRFSGTVTAIDTVARKVVATIPVPGHPSGLAVDPASHHLWVASRTGISVVDPASFTVSATLRLDDEPAYIAIDPQSRTAFVTHADAHSVSLIDTANRAPVGNISLGERGMAYAAAVDPAAHSVYLTGGAFQTVTVIDTRTRAVTAVRNAGVSRADRYGSDTYGVAVDPENHHVYVTNSGVDGVEVLAPR